MSPEPYRCPPLTQAHRVEYGALADQGIAPQLRAWVREADKACRANLALIKE